MDKSKIVLGMKVVPFQKTVCGNLDGSIAWKHAKKKGQMYLYVVGVNYVFGKIAYKLWHTEANDTGDYFRAEDFKPYRGKK